MIMCVLLCYPVSFHMLQLFLVKILKLSLNPISCTSFIVIWGCLKVLGSIFHKNSE